MQPAVLWFPSGLEQKAASYEGMEDDRYKLEQMNLRLNEEIKQLQDEIYMLRQDLNIKMSKKSKFQGELEQQIHENLDVKDQLHRANKLYQELVGQIAQFGHWYQPVTNDPIDDRLNEYINWSPFRYALSQLFFRDKEGTYTFGTKRCFMKLQQNNLKVSVGAGVYSSYLTIDEFVDYYLPIEMKQVQSELMTENY